MRTSLGSISDNGHYNDRLLHNGHKTMLQRLGNFRQPLTTGIHEYGACFLLSVDDDSVGDSGGFQDREISPSTFRIYLSFHIARRRLLVSVILPRSYRHCANRVLETS